LTSGTFDVSTDTMQATAPGAYLKFNVSGTVNLALVIDNSTNSSFPSGDMPIVRYSIDAAAFMDVQLAPSQTSLMLSSSLSTTLHSVEVYFKASSSTNNYADVWGSSGVSPTNVLRVNGITIDGGGSVSAATPLSKRMLIFGDSITAGEHANIDGSDDATQSFAPMLARALGAEFAQLGYGGQGWTVIGNSNVAAFINAWNLYSVGRSRSMSGYDYIAVVHGGNDARASVSGSTIQSDVEAWLWSVRSAAGDITEIFVIVECMGAYESNISAAVAAYKTSSSDAKVYFVDATELLPSGVFGLTFGETTEWTYDGVHPLVFGHGRIGACYAAAAQSAMSATTLSGYSRSRVVNT
jgi:lysophospholipase L1-like esterase